MNDWNKLLIYELATEHAKGSFNSAKYRVEVFLKEGNTIDETRPVDEVAIEVNFSFEARLIKQEEEKQANKQA
jgi:UDP-3-O-acyl-N-acetylglucosamine deacetylase